MGTSEPPRRRGRPAKEGHRQNVTIRMRDEVKARIEEIASSNRRSLSEEIETRIEASFLSEDILSFLFGSGLRQEETLILRHYLGAIRAATALGGDDPGRWMHYAPKVPFAFDPKRWAESALSMGMEYSFDVDAMTAAVRRQVEENILGRALVEIAAHGAPTFGTDEETTWRLHIFTRACACLFRLSLSEEKREPYAPIYETAAAWAAEHKAMLTPFEREKHTSILELAASVEEWLRERRSPAR